ncbi:MAG: TetR/AcrR family transcriptional regulator [Ktedonobacterales bacterium]|nr:TetR/AcrR family transcriptional regulator [Ktedonobacterales bacterium]
MDSQKLAAEEPARRELGEPGAKTRRRGDSLETDILQAAWDELMVVGYSHLTMEGVAERAKTSKAVVYRRWHSRAELVIAAMIHHQPLMGGDVPDTGSLRGDILILLRRMSLRLEEVGAESIHGLMGEYFNEVPLVLYLRGRQPGAESMSVILRRAAERGEIDSAKVTPRIASLPADLVRHEILLTHAPISDATIVEIVDDIFLPLLRP